MLGTLGFPSFSAESLIVVKVGIVGARDFRQDTEIGSRGLSPQHTLAPVVPKGSCPVDNNI